MCPGARAIKLNYLPSVKDVNMSKVFMFDQTATEELKTLTPTRAARYVIDQGRNKKGFFRACAFGGLLLSFPDRGEGNTNTLK